MKKSTLLTFAFALLLSAVSFAQTNTQQTKPTNVAVFEWLQPETKDFAKIGQGTPVTATFKFKNTGKIPLVISNVQASCGCTTPNYSKEPIAPGESGFVMATYNAANPGAFHKSVTVSANVEGGSVVLYLKGEVDVKTANQ
jgi:hypothetical protein